VTARASLLKLVAAALVGLLVTGCGAKSILTKPPQSIAVSINVVGGPTMNPDAAGRPSPVFLRVYALSEEATFMAAEFDALTSGDESMLAAGLVRGQSFAVRPGEQRNLEWELDPTVKFLAAVAEFRDPLSSVWRATLPLDGERPKKNKAIRVDLRLDGPRLQWDRGD
jgi:type VI secretion system protein VasD